MKYKKIILFTILIVVTIPICMYIATIVHFTITNQFISISDMKMNLVINSVINDEKCRNLYLLTQSLITLFFILFTFIQKDNIYASKLGNITNNIRTPFTVGQGQYGTARWLRPKEFESIFNKNTLDIQKDMKHQSFNNAGLVVGYKKIKNGNEEIYCVDSNTHSLTVRCYKKWKVKNYRN